MPAMLEVDPDLASKIQARARERGVSVDVYLRDLIEGSRTEDTRRLAVQECVRLLREWASGQGTDTPLLSDNAISRERIYGDRG